MQSVLLIKTQVIALVEEFPLEFFTYFYPFGWSQNLVQAKFGNRQRWIVISGLSVCHTGTPGCASSHSFGKIKPELFSPLGIKHKAEHQNWKSFTPGMKFLFGVTANLCRGTICSKSNSAHLSSFDDGNWVTQCCADQISSGSVGNLQLPRGQLCFNPAKVSGDA